MLSRIVEVFDKDKLDTSMLERLIYWFDCHQATLDNAIIVSLEEKMLCAKQD